MERLPLPGGAETAIAVVFAPAGMEEFFKVLATTDEPAAMLELARRHGWDFS